MNNNIEEHFEESEGGGTDNDNFTNPGSGTGSYEGNDFAAAPIPEFEYEPPGYEYEPPGYEYEPPEFEYEPPPVPNDPNLGFNDPNLGFNDPNLGFNDPNLGFNDPNPGFNDPNPGFNNPNPGFNNPNSGFNDPNSGFNDPNPGFNYYDPVLNNPESDVSNDPVRSDYLVFDDNYYREQNPEISDVVIDPFRHFVNYGAADEKEYRYTIEIDYTLPDQEILQNDDDVPNNAGIAREYTFSGDLTNLEYLETSNGDFLAFDISYYELQNTDVSAADVDPLLHFSQFGLRENREHRYTFIDDLPTYNSDNSLTSSETNTNIFDSSDNSFV